MITEEIRLDIRDAIQEISEYVESFTLEEFINDSKTLNATIRQLEVIGEASNHLSETLKVQNSDIPWRNIVGIRNLLIHQYFGVDAKLVWNVIKVDLPVLESRVNLILKA